MSFLDRDNIYNDLSEAFPIPKTMQDLLLPGHQFSVPAFLKFSIPTLTATSSLFESSTLFSKYPSYLQDNASSAQMIQSFPIPTLDNLKLLAPKTLEAHRSGHKSFNLHIKRDGTEMDIRLHLWVFTYWYIIRRFTEVMTVWKVSEKWLQPRVNDMRTSHAVALLEKLSWGVMLPRNLGGDVVSLSRFLSHRWLNEENIDQLRELFERHQNRIAPSRSTATLSSAAIIKLFSIFRYENGRSTYLTMKKLRHVHGPGDLLHSGSLKELGISVPVRVNGGLVTLPNDDEDRPANHWVAIVVKTNPPVLLYGDPMRLPFPGELFELLQWWLGLYLTGKFTEGILECTQQSDGFSCGMLSTNALHHYFDPESYPLLDALNVDAPRIDAFINTVEYAQELDGRLIALPLSSTHVTALHPPSTNASIAVKQQSDAPTDSTSQRRRLSEASILATSSSPAKRAKNEPDTGSSGVVKPKIVVALGAGKALKDASDVAEKPAKKRPVGTLPVRGSLEGKKGTGEVANRSVGKVVKIGGKSLTRVGEGRVGSGENGSRAMTLMDCLFVKTCLPKSMQNENAFTPTAPSDSGPTEKATAGSAVASIIEQSSHQHIKAETVEDPGASDAGDEEEGVVLVDPSEIVNVEEEAKDKGKGGRPRVELLDKLVRRCIKRKEPTKLKWRCVGGGELRPCHAVFANRGIGRVIKHAVQCTTLDPALQSEAATYAVANSLSSVIKLLKKKPGGKKGGAENEQSLEEPEESNEHPWFQIGRVKGRKLRHLEMDLTVVKLVCAGGLPPSVVSHPEWIELLRLADKSYKPSKRSELEDVLIPQEAAWVREEQFRLLQAEENLTASFDGGTTAGRESFWIMHVSTPSGVVYFVSGREATSESHTAKFIVAFVYPVLERIGLSRIACINSDSTANTVASREDLDDLVPVAIPLADVVHFTHNFVKDLCSLKCFEPPIKVVRGTISVLHTSHAGHAQLKHSRERHQSGRGLEAIGKTRFATMILSSVSVQRCTPAIKDVIQSGVASFKEIEEYFSPTPSMKTFLFERGLSQLINVGLPATKAIACLEAVEATAADVYLFWHAIVRATEDALHDPKNDYAEEVVHQVIGILNARYNELFGSGKIASKAYLAAAYLNSSYLKSSLFKEEGEDPKLLGIRHPSIFRTVARFLVGLAGKEIEHGHKPVFTSWRGRGRAFSSQFEDELLKYARNQYPFNLPVSDQQPHAVREWWQALVGDQHALILPHLAIKLYSICVNSMPDERTARDFKAITPRIRNRTRVETMTDRTMIRQFLGTQAKIRKHSRPHPTIKFFDIKSDIFPSSDDAEPPMPDDEDDTWLDEPATEYPGAEVTATDQFINTDSDLLRELLSEEQLLMGSGEPGSKAVGDAQVAGEEDDNDYHVLSF